MKNEMNRMRVTSVMDSKEVERIATRVSMVSILGNAALSIAKLIAGVIAHSGAMVSDAVHSASDVISSIVVIIGIRLAAKEADKEHPYGHERMECVAAIILSVLLFATGAGSGFQAVKQIFANDTTNIVMPGMLAMVAAIISIITKEAMFWYTKYYANKIDSGALMADAWHHRSDALSSVGALIGIWGARRGYVQADALASIVICVFIGKAAHEIFVDAMDKMVDHACDAKEEEAIRECVRSVSGVMGIDLLQTRVFGNKIYVDLEISADGNSTLFESHEIAEKVHDLIENNFPNVKHIMIHVNPYKEEKSS